MGSNPNLVISSMPYPASPRSFLSSFLVLLLRQKYPKPCETTHSKARLARFAPPYSCSPLSVSAEVKWRRGSISFPHTPLSNQLWLNTEHLPVTGRNQTHLLLLITIPSASTVRSSSCLVRKSKLHSAPSKCDWFCSVGGGNVRDRFWCLLPGQKAREEKKAKPTRIEGIGHR